MIVSMSHFLFDHVQTGSNPNANPLCGLKLRATRVDERTGKERSVDLTVVDRCKYLSFSVRVVSVFGGVQGFTRLIWRGVYFLDKRRWLYFPLRSLE